MAVNEEIVTGRKFRKLIDEATKLWQRMSFWTKASDVEFDDGSTAETKMGAINGITDSLASTSSNIAASAKAINQLNNKLANGRVEIVVNDDKSLGYKLDGADTVFPFYKTISFTINWNIQIKVDGSPFDHKYGSIRLKVTKNSVTVVSGSWPDYGPYRSSRAYTLTVNTTAYFSDIVVE